MTDVDRGRLVLRHGTTEVVDAAALVRWYDEQVAYGPTYYRAPVSTSSDEVTVEDLGFAVLFVGRPGPAAARSLVDGPVDISAVPGEPLATLDAAGVAAVAEGIASLVRLRGFGSAVATKVLHKKRPASVPVLDNKAIFATYLVPEWVPGTSKWPQASVSVRDPEAVAGALEAIRADLAEPSNAAAWASLEATHPDLTRIEIFDMVWWALAHGAGEP